jgi:hypothetical protein
MPSGITAGWLAAVSLVIAALVAGYFNRAGGILNRRTQTEQMLYDRLKFVETQKDALEAECQRLQDDLQVLRQQNIKGLIALERLAEIDYRLRMNNPTITSAQILAITDEDRSGET